MKLKTPIAILLSILFISFSFNSPSFAQTNPQYYDNLYYLCKVWGFVKYFHSEVAKGQIQWDAVLLSSIEEMENASDKQSFNEGIKNLIRQAGPLAVPVGSLLVPPDSLRFNLNLGWLQDDAFTEEVKLSLDSVRTEFRHQDNYYVQARQYVGNPDFDNDKNYYTGSLYPNEPLRLLALFRYWNMINYFFPYKNIMDQDWDVTLEEFIPKFVKAPGEVPYHMVFLELTTRIDDTHAYTSSYIVQNDIMGSYYLPIRLGFIENQTVVTKVLLPDLDIKVGDIIRSIDLVDIGILRERLRKYTAASNEPTRDRNINSRLVRGTHKTLPLVIENTEGQEEIRLDRTLTGTQYYNLQENTNPPWQTISSENGYFGYVDMDLLEREDVPQMFDDLWETDGIIFDVRNYPRGSMWAMINFLYDGPIFNARFTKPDVKYPGTLKWITSNIGYGDFSRTYSNDIYILFNEKTQSHAEYTVMALEQHPKAVKIGSQTAAADGNVSGIYLPGGIFTYMTGLGVFYPDFTPTQRIGIVPDIEVHPTIQGIREGRDEMLEVILGQPRPGSEPELVENFALHPNYPNPFNMSTTIPYEIDSEGVTTVTVYDIRGRRVHTLMREEKSPGLHTILWDGLDGKGNPVGSGIYTIRLDCGKEVDTRKVVLIR